MQKPLRAESSPGYVSAWDLPTRLFHWSLVALIVAAWTTAEFAERLRDATLNWHRAIGTTILILLFWRLLWGLVGSPTSRFASFVRSPGAALAYGRSLASGVSANYLGHNPLGALMILALLATVAAQAGLGLFTVEHNDLAEGPLAKLVSDDWAKFIRRWHHYTFNRVLLPLVSLHILANVLYGAIKKDPLIRAMVTGRKPDGAYVDAPSGGTTSEGQAPLSRALLCLAVAAVLVLGILKLLGGRFY